MNNLDLKQFNTACDELVAGKYILANIKIKSLINSINNSEQLTTLVSSSLDNFDFNTTFRESVLPNKGLRLPDGDKNVIAYCFNILYNLDAGTITFLDFLNKYFLSSQTNGGDEFKMFVNNIIAPFKQSLNNEYSRVYDMTSTEDYQNNLYHKLMNVASVNINEIDTLRLKDIEREELELLLNAIITASSKNDKKLIYAIMVGLEYFVKYNKHARHIYFQLKDCFEQN